MPCSLRPIWTMSQVALKVSVTIWAKASLWSSASLASFMLQQPTPCYRTPATCWKISLKYLSNWGVRLSNNFSTLSLISSRFILATLFSTFSLIPIIRRYKLSTLRSNFQNLSKTPLSLMSIKLSTSCFCNYYTERSPARASMETFTLARQYSAFSEVMDGEGPLASGRDGCFSLEYTTWSSLSSLKAHLSTFEWSCFIISTFYFALFNTQSTDEVLSATRAIRPSVKSDPFFLSTMTAASAVSMLIT